MGFPGAASGRGHRLQKRMRNSVNYPIFAKNFHCMETSKKSTGLYWLLFFASVAAFFFVYSIGGGYCSMVLPFNCTFLAKAMDLM